MELSIVIPVYNEEENVEPLIGEIEGVLAAAEKTYEIIAVDDGSKDRTFMLLRQLHADPASAQDRQAEAQLRADRSNGGRLGLRRG